MCIRDFFTKSTASMQGRELCTCPFACSSMLHILLLNLQPLMWKTNSGLKFKENVPAKNMCTSSSCPCHLLPLEVRELNTISRVWVFKIAGWFYDSAQIPLWHGTVHSVNCCSELYFGFLMAFHHESFDSTKCRIKLHLLLRSEGIILWLY